jgi:hypothetical protein
MKALTVRQPYAGLIAAGIKQYETRPASVHPTFRGDLIIHAGKAIPAADWSDPIPLDMYADFNLRRICRVLGKALCIVTVTDIVRVEDIRDTISSFERAFGDYTDGRMAWKLEHVRLLSEPIPARGQLGIWEWKGDIE